MTETHDYERRREIAQWYADASGWHREINETTPNAVREAMGTLIRCARQMMLRHADEVLAACAEVERLRAELRRMSEWHDEIADSLRAEVERLRADLREAMELLRAHGHPPTWLNLGEAADWNTRYGKLLKKHKERP